jgi:hypothetical protein
MNPPNNPPPRRSLRFWVLLSLGCIFFCLLLGVVGLGGYFFGRLQGIQEGLKMVQPWEGLFPPPAGRGESHYSQSGQGPVPNQIPNGRNRPLPRGNPPPPPAGPAGNPLPEGMEEGGIPSLEQVEQMLQGMVPGGGEVPPVKPSAEMLAKVNKGKSDDAKAVRAYFKEVHQLSSLDRETSALPLFQGMRGGDPAAQKEGLSLLKKSFQDLLKVSVPPRCVEYHALILTLLTDLTALLENQGVNRSDDMDQMVANLTRAQRVLSLQKQTKKLESEILASL